MCVGGGGGVSDCVPSDNCALIKLFCILKDSVDLSTTDSMQIV